VTLSVEDTGIVGLIGPNGAGKTTLFNLISGIIPPDEGSIVFEGRPIHGLAPHVISRRGLGRTFQDPRVYAELSVLDNVIVGLRLRGEAPLWAALRDRRTRAEWGRAREIAESMLNDVGLFVHAQDRAGDLSFGQQRFLSIARSLVSNPRLVLMDEPTVGLDKAAIDTLLRLLERLVSQRSVVLLVVEHNMDVIMSLASKIALLVQGRLAAVETPQDLRSHASMIEAYLGVDDAAAG
jgi:ABC-type branched-subunit amino acid transport system ATPase component